MKGTGIYLRGLSEGSYGTPKQAAKKAKDNGISFVAILAAWQYPDKTIMSNGRDPSLIQKYADAFFTAGIDVWLWGYPWAGREHEYVDRLAQVSESCKVIQGWLHDPELGYKWTVSEKQKILKCATELKRLTQCYALDPIEIGVTSYGMPKGQPNFPWSVFGSWGFGSPQLYTVGPADVDRGIVQWREKGWKTILPSVPLYGVNSGAKLHDFLSSFVDGEEFIDGFIFWSWPQASDDEWRVMARWADWLQRGACTI
jgi:hypothetical protein